MQFNTTHVKTFMEPAVDIAMIESEFWQWSKDNPTIYINRTQWVFTLGNVILAVEYHYPESASGFSQVIEQLDVAMNNLTAFEKEHPNESFSDALFSKRDDLNHLMTAWKQFREW